MLHELTKHLESINCPYEVILVRPEDEEIHNLSDRSPANVGPDGKIYVMERLPEEDRHQAIAHEMAHIFFQFKGQVSLENYEDQHNLPLEINNVISHRAIIEMLSNQFRIQSTFHKDLRTGVIENGNTYLTSLEQTYNSNLIGDIDYYCFLATLALQLRDIELCFPEYQNQVNEIVTTHPYLEKVINTARNLLFDASSFLPETVQKSKINQFIHSIDFDINDFDYR